MTDHRCDAEAGVTDAFGPYDQPLFTTRCDLFLGHEGDHRVLLTWPDPVAAAEDAAWSAERNDPDETFDVDVPIESGPSGKITPRSCDAACWNDDDDRPYYCGLALGHAGEHAIYSEAAPRSASKVCGNRWDNQLGEPFTCHLIDGHDGPHYRDDGAEPGDREHAVAYTSEDIDRVRRERLGERAAVCSSVNPSGATKCTWPTGHYGYHNDMLGNLWQ